MSTFLSPAWLEQLSGLAGGDQVGPGASVVQQLVTGGPNGEIAYFLEIQDGRVRASPGWDERAVVTLTETWDTAVRLHRGELTARQAFMHGLVRVRGDVRQVLMAASGLAALGPALTALREDTVDA